MIAVATRWFIVGITAGAILLAPQARLAGLGWAAEVEEAQVSIVVKPLACFEPCAIRVAVTITNYEAEREVCLAIYDASIVSADDPSQRSCWPWAGRKITDVGIKNISAGTYNVVVSLTAAAGRRAQQTLRVAGGNDALTGGDWAAGRK